MLNLQALIYQELYIQNKVHHLVQYTLVFFSFCLLCINMINSPAAGSQFVVIFLIVLIPLLLLSLPSILVKPDVEDGYHEMLLVAYSANQIVTARYLALSINISASFLLSLLLLSLLYNITHQDLPKIAICGLLLITISSALGLLIAAIQAYFRSNTNLLSILVMPLIIPTLILSGLILQGGNCLSIASIMLGINLVIIPISLYLTTFLLKSIYNI